MVTGGGSPKSAEWKNRIKKLGLKRILLTFVTLLALLVFGVLAAYQSAKSIIRYYEEAVVTSISERDLEFDDYPHVVLCSNEILEKMASNTTIGGEDFLGLFHSRPALSDMKNYPWESVSLENYEESLKNYTIEYEIGLLGGTTTPIKMEKAKRLYTSVAGMCIHFHPWIKDQQPEYVSVTVPGGHYDMKVVHNLQELGMVYATSKMRQTFQGVYIVKRNVAFKISVKQSTRVPTKDFVCSREKDYLQAKCFDECISKELMKDKRIACGMPWMKPRLNAPDCNSYERYKQLFQILQHDDDMNPYANVCNKRCPEACRRIIYTLEQTVPQDLDGDRKLITLSVNPTFKIVNEFVAYEFMNVVGDVGGIVGILLGFSAFGLVQMLIDYIQKSCIITD